MFNIAFSFVALVFLLALVAYVLTLVANNSRIQANSQRNADLEADLLKARIEQIMDERRQDLDKLRMSWNGFRKFRIVSKNMVTDDICSIELSPHDGKPLPAFLPGQYLTFQIQVPSQSHPLIRCYSLSDSPFYPERYRIMVKRIRPTPENPDIPHGLVSNFFHDSINERDIVDVKAPSGHFFLQMTQNFPVVLIAGGVGITPILSMLNTIAEMGQKRETWLFFGVHNSKHHVMPEHFKMIDQENEFIQVRVFYSSPQPNDVVGEHYHHEGRITIDKIKEILPSNNYDFFICAPPPMVKDLRTNLKDWGVPKKNIHFEAFGPATVKKCKTPATEDATTKIDVNFAKTGKSVTWDPTVGSLLDFAEKHGIAIDSGCRAGNCGTCLTAIKSGTVNYISEPGSEPETGSCLTCISMPSQNLTLDA